LLVKNKDELLSNGLIEGRKLVLDVMERTLNQVNYYNIIKRIMTLEGDVLRARELKFDLKKFNNVYLVGGGKNASFMALALEEILEDKIRDGIIIEKKGSKQKTAIIPLIEGGHPIPDEDSIRGAEKIISIARNAGENDLLIVCVSGGWTALASSPPEEISLEEFRKTYELLLKSGMTLTQMNIVRYHLSRLGRGKIPMLTNKATVLGLIAVDEVGGLPWGPTVPDNTTFSDAIRVLKQFDLLHKIPESTRRYLEKADPTEETPKENDYGKKGVKVHNLVIADNIIMCEIAQREAEKLGINAFILSTTLEGEAKHVGTLIASIANEISKFNRPFKPPCVLIAGGETTVTITGEAGEGGRNQEVALSAALNLPSRSKIVISSLGTDGTDGPTDIAGAIVDGTTMQRATNMGIDVIEELKRHNSSFVFRKLGDAIYTYDTGTNLMDLIVVYIESA